MTPWVLLRSGQTRRSQLFKKEHPQRFTHVKRLSPSNRFFLFLNISQNARIKKSIRDWKRQMPQRPVRPNPIIIDERFLGLVEELINLHADREDNPHKITPYQIGAITKPELAQALSQHIGANDPHPSAGYLKEDKARSLFSLTGHTHRAADIQAATPADIANAIALHKQAEDAHSQLYLLKSVAQATYALKQHGHNLSEIAGALSVQDIQSLISGSISGLVTQTQLAQALANVISQSQVQQLIASAIALTISEAEVNALIDASEQELLTQIATLYAPANHTHTYSASNIGYTNSGQPSFQTVADALNQIFFVPLDITAFAGGGTYERGQVIASINFTWTSNKNLSSQSINQGIGSISPSLRSYNATGLNVTANVTYTITATAESGESDTATTAINFRSRRYWGVSAATSLNNAGVLALSSELATARSQTKTFNATAQYLYIAYPTSFGLASFTINGLTSTAWELVTTAITNSFGFTENYYIYRSSFIQNGSGITVVVS